MSRKKRKFRFIRLILVLMIIAALVAVVFFGIKYFYTYINTNSEDKEKVNDEITPSSNEECKISVQDYTVYYDDLEELGFNFIIASLKFETSQDTLYYDLTNLTNSEREIKLSQIQDYIDKLQLENYDVKNFNIVTEVRSDTNIAVVNILIPFVSKVGELNVYNGEKLTFNLNKNTQNASVLKPTTHEDQTIIESNDYNISVSKSFLSNLMEHDGQEYDASGINVYTFKLYVSKVKDGISIEKAIFIKDGSTYEYEALDESYTSMKVDNIINKKLVTGEEGALFFELYKNNDENINFDGVLRIKFSDSNNWIEIPTTIK